ncbi:MAG: hypothetical protein AAFP19_09890 [Bacteroidota bacterium]
MQKSKFFQAFSSLEARIQNQFIQYLEANYPAKKQSLRLLVYLHQHIRDAVKLEKALVAKAVFTQSAGKKSLERKLSDQLTDLFGLLEEFLLWLKIKDRQFGERAFLLIDIYKERGMEQLLQQQLNKTDKHLSQEQSKGMTYYLDRMRLAHHQYYIPQSFKLRSDPKKAVGVSVAMEQLDRFFVASKLRYSCELLSRGLILQEHHPIHFLEVIEQFCGDLSAEEDPCIQLFGQMKQLLQYQQRDDYFELKTQFFEQLAVLPTEERMILLGYLINFAAESINKGQQAFIHEAFDLYKRGLAEGVFIEKGQLSDTQFNNIVNLACRLKELAWAESFIDYWQHYLDRSIKKSALAIAHARIHFEKAQYEACIYTLQKVDFRHVYYALRSKTLLLRSFYELEESTDWIISFCQSFKTYLRRNTKINREVKHYFLHFVQAVEKLCKKSTSSSPTLKSAIEGLRPMAYENWIMDKYHALLGNTTPPP